MVEIHECKVTLLSLAATLLFLFPAGLPPRSNSSQGGEHATSAKAAQLYETALGLIQKATRRDLLEAANLLERSARLFHLAHSDSQAGAAYIKLGEIYFIWSQYKRALSMYDRAKDLNNESDKTVKCSALSHIAVAQAAYGDRRSLQSSQDAVSLATQVRDLRVQGEAWAALGEVLAYGDATKALGPLQTAKTIFEQIDDADGRARTALNIGYAHYNLGLLQQALSDCTDAKRLWTSIHNLHGVARARAAAGLVWTTLGEPEKAYDEYGAARQLFDTVGDLDNEAATLVGMGGVSKELGAYEKSLQFFQQAGKSFTAVKDKLGELASIDGAALAEWGLHHYRKAESLWRDQLRRSKYLKNYQVQATSLSQLGNVYRHYKSYAIARHYYDHALTLCCTSGDSLIKTGILIQLGRLYAEERKYNDALRTLQDALKSAETTSQESSRARTYFELASVYKDLGDLTQAKRESEESIAAIESQRIKVSDFGSRATYFASVHEYYQLYINVLMQLHEQHPDQGFAAMALAAAEKSKVRSLLDMLASSNQKPACGTETHAMADGLQNEARPAMTCNIANEPLTPQQIQAAIQGDDAVLLEYSLGPEASYVWVVDEGHVSSYRLPAAQQILDVTTRFRNALLIWQSAPQQGAGFLERVVRANQTMKSTAQQLSQMLLGPASTLLTKKRLIIVPDGPLQYIPFTVLPFPAVTGTANPQLLMDRYELTNLPSASVLSLLRDDAAKRSPPTKQAAIFADPVFSSDDPRLSTASSANATVHLPSTALGAAMRDIQFGSRKIPRLPSSGIEAKNIADAFQNRDVFVARDFDASRDTVFSTDLRLYHYIHFATHGILDSKNPDLSGLILSLVDSHGKPQEGYLRLRDIYNLHLSADLVVLSSCNSALGKDLGSEGIIGLPRAFLYAGSQRVISTLWKVGDDATKEFMTHFYSRLHAGQNPASALRGAQSDMANGTEWQPPYYWAAFVLQGEYR